jgi:hypothetical protein
MHLVWALFTAVPLTAVLLPLVVNLPLVVLAGLAGARLYAENDTRSAVSAATANRTSRL